MKICTEYFMESALERFLQDSGVSTLWVEFHPAFAPCKADAFLERVRDLSARFTIVPISGDPDFLGLALQSKWNAKAIALKGIEASGFVGNETAGVLFSTLMEMSSDLGAQKPGLILWGGVAMPEAAAAFLCSGAKGIAFESLHWQTDLVSVTPNLKERLSRVRPEHSTVVGTALGVSCRFFD